MYKAKINFHSEKKKFLVGEEVKDLSKEAIDYLLKENIIEEIKVEKKPKVKKSKEFDL